MRKRKRKLRGKKRKLRTIEQSLKEATSVFPTMFYGGLYTIKLPANREFIERLNQRGMARITSYFMDCVITLKHLKPHAAYKIVVLLFPENMWRSELMIFEDEMAYHEFFVRHTNTGFWREIEAPIHAFEFIHWTHKVMVESTEEEMEQTIICYIER